MNREWTARTVHDGRRIGRTALLALLVLSQFSIPPALGQIPNLRGKVGSIRTVGHIGGACQSISAIGSLVFVGQETELALLQERPGFFQPLSQIHLPGLVCDVVTSGNLALVADGLNGVQVVDFSDPTKPKLAGAFDTPGFAQDLASSGPYVFVADGPRGLRVIQFTRTGPQTLSTVNRGNTTAVVLDGTLAYVVGGSALEILDVSIPALPRPRGLLPTPKIVTDVAVSGQRAYLAGPDGLMVVNCSNPTSPFLEYNYPVPLARISVSLGLAFTVRSDGIVQVFDVSQPGIVLPLQVLSGQFGAMDIFAVSTRFYAAFGTSGIGLYQYVGPTFTLNILATLMPEPPAFRVLVSGALAYVSDSLSLYVLNVVQPTLPRLLARYTGEIMTQAMTQSGNRLYLAGGPSGVAVLDVATPTNPTLLGQYVPPFDVSDIAVQGRYGFLVGLGKSFWTVDFGNPTSPTRVGAYPLAGEPVAIKSTPQYAFVLESLFSTGGTGRLDIFDITKPNTPALRGTLFTPGSPAGLLRISNRFAYLLDSTGLQIIDITRPTLPRIVGHAPLPLPIPVSGLAVSETFAYVSTFDGWLFVYNITNTQSPRLVGSFFKMGTILDIEAQRGLVYVAEGDRGLSIVQFTGAAPQIVSASLVDSIADRVVGAGDTLILGLSRAVTIGGNTIRPEHFYLPVQGDQLGSTGFIVGLNPYNSRQLVVKLGLGARLTAPGIFTTTTIVTGAPSGIDFAADLPFGAIMSSDGFSAIDTGVPGVDDAAIDIRVSLLGVLRAIAAAGGTVGVLPSLDAAYTRHKLVIPALALASSTTLGLREPANDLGVPNAIQVTSNRPGLRFGRPATIGIEYHEDDIDWERGLLESEMRVHQLVTDLFGSRFVPLPGPQVISRFGAIQGAMIRFSGDGSGVVETQIDSLNPAGSQDPLGVFAGIPIETVDDHVINIKPGGGGAGKNVTGPLLMPGPNGAYTSHSIEFPGYVATTANDPQRTSVTIRMASMVERYTSTDGQSFPTYSGAIFVIETANGAGQPVAFTAPVNLMIQFKERDVESDVVKFNEVPSESRFMRIVGDERAGTDVDFDFIPNTGQAVDVSKGLVSIQGFTGLTNTEGIGILGAVAQDLLSNVRLWPLYR
jgi:hypothetical protein